MATYWFEPEFRPGLDFHVFGETADKTVGPGPAQVQVEAGDVFQERRTIRRPQVIVSIQGALRPFTGTKLKLEEKHESHMPHPMHHDHLCHLINVGYMKSNPDF